MGRMFWWQLSVLLLAGMAAGAQVPNSNRNGQPSSSPPAASGVASAANPANAEFQGPSGGYLISSAFRIDPDRPGVIRLPASVRAGDLIWIRPMRLNSDEYLILQKCIDADCSKAEVVRAWNAYGYMGPYPVLTNKVRVQPGVRYMLWMQRVPTMGTGSFRLYDRDAPSLVFKPAGSPELFKLADLKAAQEHGPAQIKKAQPERATFVVTFEGGSVVRMQALRVAAAGR
jgi:hypothetical protein